MRKKCSALIYAQDAQSLLIGSSMVGKTKMAAHSHRRGVHLLASGHP